MSINHIRNTLELKVPSSFILHNSKTGHRVILTDPEVLNDALISLIDKYCNYPLYATLNGEPVLPRELAQIWFYYRTKDVDKDMLPDIYTAIDDLNKANKARSLPIEKLQHLISLSSAFPKLFNKMLSDERVQYTRMKQVSRYLTDNDHSTRAFDLTLSKMTYRIQLPGKYITDIQLDFLSHMAASSFIPCITAISGSKIIHKIYKDDDMTLKWIDYKYSYLLQFMISYDDNIYYGYYDESLHSVFIIVTKISESDVIAKKITEVIEAAYMNIIKDDVSLRYIIHHISGYFCIENIHLKNHHIFMEFLSTHPLKNIVKCDESQYTFAQRTQFRMKSVIESKVTITIKEIKATGRTIMKKSGCSIKLPKDSLYTKVKLSGAKSLDSLKTVADIMNKIIAEYLEEAPKLTKIYNKVLPYKKWKVDYIGDEVHNNETDLISADPELFTSKYSRAIQKFPPVSVTEKEAYRLLKKGHEVIRYPCNITNTYRQPKVNPNAGYYISPFEDKPYLQLIPNKTLVNKNEHPWIIKCDVKQWLKSGINKHDEWYITLLALHNPEQKSIINTEKLFTGCTSEISITVKNLMSSVTKYDTDFYRYCVQVSRSSIIHCLLYALRDSNYLSIEGEYDSRYIDRPKEKVTDELREAYVGTVRSDIATTINPEICIQECWDITLESISEAVADPSVYLDPTKYIKMIERYFKVNIFLVTPVGNMIESRYNEFNILRNRSIYDTTVVLMVHSGTECSPSEVPNCDLIISTLDRKKVFSYDKKTGNRLLGKMKRYSYASKGVRKNVIDSDVPASMYKYQIIDTLGKLRAVVLKNGIVICITPSVPSYKPVYKGVIKSSTVDIVKDWVDVYEDVKITTVVMDSTDRHYVKGLIVSIDGTDGYISVKNPKSVPKWLDKIPKTYEVITYDISRSQNEGKINTYIRSSKCREVMRSILQVIYAYNPLTLEFNRHIKMLIKKYIVLIEGYDAYEPTLRIIPSYNEDNYIDVLSKWANTFFDHNMLIISSSRELESVKQYIKTLSYKSDVVKPEYIESYYVYRTDFICGSKQLIYFSTEELKEELELNSLVKPMQMLSKFNSDIYSKIRYAYLCSFSGTIFVVQNVEEGNLDKALQVSVEWIRYKVNIGYHISYTSEDIKNYNTYEIENSIIINRSNINSLLPSVLKFNEDIYAALLEI